MGSTICIPLHGRCRSRTLIGRWNTSGRSSVRQRSSLGTMTLATARRFAIVDGAHEPDGYSAIGPSRALIDSRMFDVTVSTLPARIAQVEETLKKATRRWAVVACLVSTLTGCGSPDT